MHSLFKNALSNYVGLAVTSILALLLTPFLIHRLGDSVYGVWIVLKTALAYFQLLEIGVPPALIRYVSRHRARGERREVEDVLGASLRILVVPAILVLPLVWLLGRVGPALFELDPEHLAAFRAAIPLLGGVAIVAYYKRALFAVIEGYQRFDLLNLCSVSGELLGAGLIVGAVIQGHGIVTLIAILLIQTVYETLVEAIIVVRILRIAPRIRAVARGTHRKLMSFSYYAFLIDVAVSIAYRIDTLVIAAFLPLSAVTYYTIGTKLAMMLEKITDPLINLFFPMASELESGADAGRLRALYEEGTRITTLMITPPLAILWWFGPDVIGWWVGPEYMAEAAPVLQIFLLVVALAVFEATSSRILLGCGRVRFDANVSLGTAAANLAISLALVRTYGIVGVAWGTLIPALITSFIAIPYTCRITGSPMVRFYLHSLGPSVLVAVVSWGLMTLLGHWFKTPVVAFGASLVAVSLVGGLVLLSVLRKATLVRFNV